MARILFSLVLAAAVFSFAGPDRVKPVVAVTLSPYAKIVHEIAGDHVEIVTLVPPNANPHTFEPKPATLRNFARAALYFSDGSGMDKAWKPRFLGANPHVRVVDISRGISFIREEDHDREEPGRDHEDEHERGDGHRGDELDPHLWNSPRQAILLASNICAELVELDAANAGAYRTNLEAFNQRMTALDERFLKLVRPLSEEGRTFIVFHPSYGYLARDYGLKQIAVEMDGKEPKPRDMANLVREAKENHVSAVFVQPQFSKRSSESLSREIHAKIVTIDPLAYDFDKSLVRLMEALAGDSEK